MSRSLTLCLLPTLLLLFIVAPLNAQRTIDAARVSGTITIDGRLDEPSWRRPGASEFLQLEPQPGAAATERTEIWVAYDDEALYVAARLHDTEAGGIATNFGRRDAEIETDWFWIGIDAYQDRRSGAYFAVNPAGAVQDGILFNDTENDPSWDAIWDRATSIDDQGWTVELRIPYSQLRFDDKPDHVWGFNARRTILRKGEEDHFALMPRDQEGYVSRFASLRGLQGITPPGRIEVIPYVVAGSRFLQHQPDDPFVTGNDVFSDVGADLRLGVGSSLTLDATINPDFGQVEVDPASVNLSAFETFYQEKRPFFVEGSGLFSFGSGGGYGWFNPTWFYTRRVGRPPQIGPTHSGFTDIPDRTTILGAGKLTGRVADGWSIGAMTAVTAREFAEVDSAGVRFQDEVEPLASYSVVRTRGEFNGGLQGLGLLATGVVRDLHTDDLRSTLNSSALTVGIDGWNYLDERRGWVMVGWGGISHVAGSQSRITRLQRSSQRYFQQPDADHLELDPEATSLDGWAGRILLAKRSGNLHVSTALGAISPGFEANDLGFSGRADYINGHVDFDYNWYEPDGIFRQKGVSGHAYGSYNFGGIPLNAAFGVGFEGEFENFWGFDVSIDYTPLTYDTRSTRGGPMIDGPSGWFGNASAHSDSRLPVQGYTYGGGSTSPDDIWNVYIGGGIVWRPVDQLRLSVGPNFNRDFARSQYIGTFVDSLATHTFGARYVFSDLRQNTLSADVRIDWAFTPELSLQIYAQPFLASGRFTLFKELARPKSYDFNVYGDQGSTITRDGIFYIADPDGEGPAEAIAFPDPDFNFKSLRGTAVLRWEYRPGSTLYLVWTHNRVDFNDPGTMSVGRDLSSLLSADSDNILLLKASFWINP